MNDVKEFSPFKLAVGAIVGVILLNFILRVILKLEGAPVTWFIAGIVPCMVFLWVVKVVRCAPTKSELSRFILFYSGMIAALCLIAILLAYLNGSINAAGIAILFLHYLLYPFCARLFFSPKPFESAFKKKKYHHST
ncbi:MAG: hypothetical protein EPN21_10320 [Methylococcaceae bacterium]|nr:MAG: hypothetical protein EPN21_10320 [Methylococcaceae bacterium]